MKTDHASMQINKINRQLKYETIQKAAAGDDAADEVMHTEVQRVTGSRSLQWRGKRVLVER